MINIKKYCLHMSRWRLLYQKKLIRFLHRVWQEGLELCGIIISANMRKGGS